MGITYTPLVLSDLVYADDMSPGVAMRLLDGIRIAHGNLPGDIAGGRMPTLDELLHALREMKGVRFISDPDDGGSHVRLEDVQDPNKSVRVDVDGALNNQVNGSINFSFHRGDFEMIVRLMKSLSYVCGDFAIFDGFEIFLLQ